MGFDGRNIARITRAIDFFKSWSFILGCRFYFVYESALFLSVLSIDHVDAQKLSQNDFDGPRSIFQSCILQARLSLSELVGRLIIVHKAFPASSTSNDSIIQYDTSRY